MAAASKVDETVKALRGFKTPAGLAAHFGITEGAARFRINAVVASGVKLETQAAERQGDRGRSPTAYCVKPSAAKTGAKSKGAAKSAG